jgi:alkanesulfonate monooxygenase SsuD/methylene tetrahydromethanopterin reductase-like flavin-dependent oxidoreductase (luciferase family)
MQARGVDRLGYTRYWFAEHHNMANIATSGSVVRPAPIR